MARATKGKDYQPSRLSVHDTRLLIRLCERELAVLKVAVEFNQLKEPDGIKATIALKGLRSQVQAVCSAMSKLKTQEGL